ncbi:MAG TPA: hypothetical protein VHR86_04550 [Armatimonadota bacterium]|nr:hypothetical protein [Armatimonadota bacterium]
MNIPLVGPDGLPANARDHGVQHWHDKQLELLPALPGLLQLIFVESGFSLTRGILPTGFYHIVNPISNSKRYYTSPTFVSDDLIAYLRDDRDGWRIYLSPTDRVEEHAWEGQTPENLIGSVTITAVPGSQGEVPAFILAGRPGLLYLSVAAPRLVLRCTREGDIFRYPAVSPDGKKIAFARDIPEGIWVVNSNGTGLRQLDKGGSWPAWSPDGKYLAFLTTALVTRGLSVVDQAGIEKQRTAGSFLMSIGIMSQDGKLAMPLLNSSRKSLHTRGDNVAWR